LWRNVETWEFILEKCRNRGVYHALGEGFKTSIGHQWALPSHLQLKKPPLESIYREALL